MLWIKFCEHSFRRLQWHENSDQLQLILLCEGGWPQWGRQLMDHSLRLQKYNKNTSMQKDWGDDRQKHKLMQQPYMTQWYREHNHRPFNQHWPRMGERLPSSFPCIYFHLATSVYRTCSHHAALIESIRSPHRLNTWRSAAGPSVTRAAPLKTDFSSVQKEQTVKWTWMKPEEDTKHDENHRRMKITLS